MVLSQLKNRLFVRKSLTNEQFYKWNQGLALFHAVQGALILFLSATRIFPIETSFLARDPLASAAEGEAVLVTASRHLFDVNIAYMVAIFFFVSAIAHLLLASLARKRYESDLKKGFNRVRWIEYAISESVMLLTIAVLAGVTEAALLVAIVALTAIMNLAGLVMEVINQGKSKPEWLPAVIGMVAGVVPWLVVAAYLGGSHAYGLSSAPTYLCWLATSAFVLSLGFVGVLYMQYKKTGAWKNYQQVEITYMMLNWAIKTAVAWQIFAGALRS